MFTLKGLPLTVSELNVMLTVWMPVVDGLKVTRNFAVPASS